MEFSLNARTYKMLHDKLSAKTGVLVCVVAYSGKRRSTRSCTFTIGTSPKIIRGQGQAREH